jgi:hypothetical protein
VIVLRRGGNVEFLKGALFGRSAVGLATWKASCRPHLKSRRQQCDADTTPAEGEWMTRRVDRSVQQGSDQGQAPVGLSAVHYVQTKAWVSIRETVEELTYTPLCMHYPAPGPLLSQAEDSMWSVSHYCTCTVHLQLQAANLDVCFIVWQP